MERPWQAARAATCLWVKFGIGIATALWNVVYISPLQLAMFSRPELFLGVLRGPFPDYGVDLPFHRQRSRDWACDPVSDPWTGVSILGIPFSVFAIKIGTTVTSAVAIDRP